MTMTEKETEKDAKAALDTEPAAKRAKAEDAKVSLEESGDEKGEKRPRGDEDKEEEDSAKREKTEDPAWASAAVVEAGWAAAAWFLEDEKRIKNLESIAGVDVKVTDDGKVRLRRREDSETSAEWAEQCANAMCSMQAGQNLDVTPLPQSSNLTWVAPLTVVEVPKDDAKGYILGKLGARLMQLAEDNKVIAVFVNDPEPKEETEDKKEEDADKDKVKVGALMEAKYGDKDRYFEVKITELIGDDKVKVKFTYDNDVPEEEVKRDALRALPEKKEEKKTEPKEAKLAPVTFEVGALAEAKYDGKDRWFEVRITELVGDEKVKVQFTYDEEVPVETMKRTELRGLPVIETEKVYIYGPERGRMVAELKIFQLIENKVEGYVSKRPHVVDKCKGVGWSMIPLHNEGEKKAKVIGKSGSVRIKTGKASGAALEYLGNIAYIVGTRDERSQTAALLDLIQTSAEGGVDKVPECLEDIITRVVVPEEASPMVMGKKRANMNQLEDETGVLSFWTPTVVKAKEGDKEKGELVITEGMAVEGDFKGDGSRWFEAKVVEVKKADGETTVKVKWDYDPDEDASELPASQIRPILEGEALEERKRLEATSAVKTLAIFGQEKTRKVAELRVMGLVEVKCPGSFPEAPPASEKSEFVTERTKFTTEEIGRCTEERRKSVAAAALCIVEHVGEYIYFAGSSEARARANDYVKWLSMETSSVPDAYERENVDKLMVPQAKVKNLTEDVLATVEGETETFVFFDDGASLAGVEDSSRLLVCGHSKAKREEAVAKLTKLQDVEPYKPKSWGEDTWGSGGDSYAPPKSDKPKVVWVIDKEEEERRKKRAARFGPAGR